MKDIYDLIEGHAVGKLTAGEQAELERLLQDRNARKIFVKHMTLLSVVRGVSKVSANAEGGRTFRRVGLPLAAAAALMIAAGIGWWRFGGERAASGLVVARVEQVSGVGFQVSGEKRTQLRMEDQIREGTAIEIGENGFVKLAYAGEATTVELSGNAATVTSLKGRFVIGKAVLEPLSRTGSRHMAKLLRLDAGRLTARVVPQPVNAPMTIISPHAEVVVKGTVLSVAVKEDRTRVAVDQGEVDMKIAGGKAFQAVKAGGVLIARAGIESLTLPWQKLKQFMPPGVRGSEYVGVATDGQLLWLTFSAGRRENWILSGLDPDTCKETRRFELEGGFEGKTPLACDGSNIWGWAASGDGLLAVDAATGKTVRTLKLPKMGSMPFDTRDGYLWVWADERKEILQMSLEDGKVLRRQAVDAPIGRLCTRMTYDRGMIYLGADRGTVVYPVRVADGHVFPQVALNIPTGFGDMAMDPKRGLWFSCSDGGIYLFDADIPE